MGGCYQAGAGLLECSASGRSVWLPDFVQEGFHSTSSGDFENTFMKAGDSETKERLRVGDGKGERLGEAALAP